MDYPHRPRESSPSAAHAKDHMRISFESSNNGGKGKEKLNSNIGEIENIEPTENGGKGKEKLNSNIGEIENIKSTDKRDPLFTRTIDATRRIFNSNPKEHRPEKVKNAIDELKNAVRQFKK